MAVLVVISALVTRQLAVGPDRMSRWQHGLEIVVETIRDQISDASRQDARPFLPFIGTLFLFIATANILEIIPGITSPAASLSTTAALAICVFVAVPIFGIQNQGWGRLPEALHRTHPSNVALQHHQRSFSHCGPGHSFVWQRNEHQPAGGDFVDHCAAAVPGGDGSLRAVGGGNSGLCVCDSFDGLHCVGDEAAEGEGGGWGVGSREWGVGNGEWGFMGYGSGLTTYHLRLTTYDLPFLPSCCD